MTRKPSTGSGPASTGFGTTVPSAATRHHQLARLVGDDRGVRHQQASAGRRARHAQPARTGPAVMNRSGLGKVARAWIVPLQRSICVVDEVQLARRASSPVSSLRLRLDRVGRSRVDRRASACRQR